MNEESVLRSTALNEALRLSDYTGIHTTADEILVTAQKFYDFLSGGGLQNNWDYTASSTTANNNYKIYLNGKLLGE